MGLSDIFKKRKKTVTIELFDKTIDTGIEKDTFNKLEEITSRPEFDDFWKEHDEKMKAYDEKNKLKSSVQDIVNVLIAIQDLSQSYYFTYSKKIEFIETSISAIKQNYINYDGKVITEAIKQCKKILKVKILESECIKFADNPFIYSVSDFHRKKLIESIDYLFTYWKTVINNLKQPSAKLKRSKYVLDGYNTLRAELVLLGVTNDELVMIDKIISKISYDEWWNL